MSSCAVARNRHIILPMLIFTINGIEVKATSAAEAAELIRELSRESKPAAAPIIPPRASLRPRPLLSPRLRNGARVHDVALAFLNKIRDAGSDGIHAEGLMSIVGARHPKGIGSKSAPLNKAIERLGFKVEDVYDNPRSPNGRIWRSGPKMDAAIEALKGG